MEGKPQQNGFANIIFEKIQRTRIIPSKQFSENDLKMVQTINGFSCCFAPGLFSNCFIFFASYHSNCQLALFFGKFNHFPSFYPPALCACVRVCNALCLPAYSLHVKHSVELQVYKYCFKQKKEKD